MFRVTLTVVMVLVVLLGALGASQLLSGSASEVERRALARADGAHLAFERLKRLRDLQMRDVAASLARSELGAYLGVLADRREDMLTVEAEAYRNIPGPPDDERLMDQRKRYVEESHAAFLASFAEDLAGRLEGVRGEGAWRAQSRADFMAEVRESLAICNSFGVNNCVFRFSHTPLEAAVRDLRREDPFGFSPSRVIVMDHRGVGVADADRPGWSDDRRFGAEHAFAMEVRSGAILRDIIVMGDSHWFATAAPVVEQGRWRGSLIVAQPIDKRLTQEESEFLGLSVSYLQGRDLFRSDLDDRDASELRHGMPAPPPEPRVQRVETERLVAQIVPITGNATNQRVRVALVTDRTTFSSPITGGLIWIWFGAVVLLVIGLVAMAAATHVFTKPYVSLDAGIHEVTNGNREYIFPDDFREEMWGSLGNNLNLMLASLTGRQLTAGDDKWEQDMLAEEQRPDAPPPRAKG